MQDKFQLRLKVLEESLRPPTNGTLRRQSSIGAEEPRSSSTSRRPISGTEEASKLLANGSRRQRTSAVSQLRASMANTTLLRNGRMTSKSFDMGRSLDAGTTQRLKAFSNGFEELRTGRKIPVVADQSAEEAVTPQQEKPDVGAANGIEDPVAGVLYDMLQKEVVNLRKASHEKDQSLKDKDDAIEVRCVHVTLSRTSISVFNLLSVFYLPSDRLGED